MPRSTGGLRLAGTKRKRCARFARPTPHTGCLAGWPGHVRVAGQVSVLLHQRIGGCRAAPERYAMFRGTGYGARLGAVVVPDLPPSGSPTDEEAQAQRADAPDGNADHDEQDHALDGTNANTHPYRGRADCPA
jgi:hypothetical protein